MHTNITIYLVQGKLGIYNDQYSNFYLVLLDDRNLGRFVLNPLFLKSRDHLVWQAALVMLVNWQNTERIRQIWWISNNDSTDTHKYIWTNIYNTSIVILFDFLKMCSIVAIFFLKNWEFLVERIFISANK